MAGIKLEFGKSKMLFYLKYSKVSVTFSHGQKSKLCLMLPSLLAADQVTILVLTSQSELKS